MNKKVKKRMIVFDNRSFRLNFEITAFVADETFAAEVEQMFLKDFAASREMQPGDYADRSFWFRLAVSLARLTAPIQQLSGSPKITRRTLKVGCLATA